MANKKMSIHESCLAAILRMGDPGGAVEDQQQAIVCTSCRVHQVKAQAERTRIVAILVGDMEV